MQDLYEYARNRGEYAKVCKLDVGSVKPEMRQGTRKLLRIKYIEDVPVFESPSSSMVIDVQ